MAEKREEILAKTKLIAKDKEFERFREINESAGRKTKKVEDDRFFAEDDEEEVDLSAVQKREVDRRGNVV